jgi:hypothetical protein
LQTLVGVDTWVKVISLSSFDRLRMTGDRLRMTGDRLRMTGDRLRMTGDRAQDDSDRLRMTGYAVYSVGVCRFRFAGVR